MKRAFVLVALSAAAILNSGPALAWNAIGHLVSAKLAYDQWDDGQRQALFAMLQKHPHFQQYLAFGRPPEIGEPEWVILRAAVWSDWVRPRRHGAETDPRGPKVTRHSREEQHYIDVPVIDPKDAAYFAGKTLISPDRTDVICALRQSANDLRNRNTAPEDKAVALCWLFHLIGDIHQPLHNAEYFSREGLEQGDLGGNLFGVRINGRNWKLHAFWDDLLGEDTAYWDDSAAHHQQLFRDAMKVAERLRGLRLSEAEEKNLARHRSFASWSQEGYELAKTVAYQKPGGGGILDHVVLKPGDPFPDNAPEAGAKYAQIAHAVADVQIVMAGRRLAERVKELLAAADAH